MERMTVEERVDQIIASGIPHIIEPGSRVRSYLSSSNHNYSGIEPIYCFESGVVEVIYTGDYETPFDHNPMLIKGFGDNLVAASGGVINKSDLQANGRFKYVGSDKVEMHAFYNAQSDMTHFFLLPARDLVAEKQK